MQFVCNHIQSLIRQGKGDCFIENGLDVLHLFDMILYCISPSQQYIQYLVFNDFSMVRIAVKDLKMTYPITSKERPCHGLMKPRNTPKVSY